MKFKALTLLTLALALSMVASPVLIAQASPIPAAPRPATALQIDPPKVGSPSGGQPASRSGALDDTPPVEDFTPFAFPSTTPIKQGWVGPDNGWASDNVRATASGGNMTVGYSGFNIGVPEYAVIDGIEVNVEGYTNGRNVAVSLSWDGGANWTSTAYTTSGLPGAAPDGNVVLGNATNT